MLMAATPECGQSLLTVREVAQRLRISRQLVERLCEFGRLEHVLVEGSTRKMRRFRPEVVDAYIESRTVSRAS